MLDSCFTFFHLTKRTPLYYNNNNNNFANLGSITAQNFVIDILGHKY